MRKETVDRLRQIDARVKAIVSSGYSNDPIMSDYQKYGFSGVVAKPYNMRSLGNALAELLAKVQDITQPGKTGKMPKMPKMR